MAGYDYAATLVAALAGRLPVDEGPQTDLILRRLLCVTHGCSLAALYGDDGEMQCNALDCRIDFKRWSPEDIEARLHQRGLERIVAAQAPKDQP